MLFALQRNTFASLGLRTTAPLMLFEESVFGHNLEPSAIMCSVVGTTALHPCARMLLSNTVGIIVRGRGGSRPGGTFDDSRELGGVVATRDSEG